ncbi:MAG: pimeloyl-ACP methyl ester esterase BioH [Gammaproteobacteria bacterium]
MSLHITTCGSGATRLVLLHGWGFHGGVWDELAARLSPDYQVSAVDLPGHGLSPLLRGGNRLEDWAEQLAAQIPGPAIWLGWSLGGLVAQAVAARYPERVQALVLATSSPRFTQAPDWPHGLPPAALDTFAARLQGNFPKTLREFIALQVQTPQFDAARLHALGDRLCAHPPSAEALHAGLALLTSSDLRAACTRLQCPAIAIYGDRDTLAPAAQAADWRGLWPGLATVCIAGAAHLPFLSHTEHFMRILGQFLGEARSTRRPSHQARRTQMPQASSARSKSDRKRNTALAPETLESLYAVMRRIRVFDEKVAQLFTAGEIKGTAHSYVGQEAIAAGICANLRESDYIASHHRGHGHCLAKGARMDRMMAELMGRDSGYCRGLGGSMHIADLELGILGANGIVGAAMPLSTGAALAGLLRGNGQVAVAFFGDGASNQGVFHEALNLAAVWKLPLVFVCENNQYALTTSYRATTSVERIAQRAAGYDIPGVTVDGNDVAEVYLVAQEAIARARAGEGPTLIEAMTYRWGQHSMRANLRDPRPRAEYEDWLAKDPLARVEAQMDKVAVGRVAAAVDDEITAAIDYGRKGVEPSLELLRTAVYAPHRDYPAPPRSNGRELTFTQALNEALAQEMARDERVFLMGEDVGATGGIFSVSTGLMDKFGAARVRDTPISEAGFVGCGVGAAIAGLRPVVEIQIFDFVALTMDMLVNQAAKFRYMLGGKNTVPLVVRGPQGGGIRLAAQHSQSLEAWFTHVPGLVVVAPSTPYDAKGLLVAAIRDDNPVIFLEAKLLYMSAKGPVPEELYALPIGKAEVKRAGTDVTVIATMAMVPRALAAADLLAREGISVEVIDPRTLKPLDTEAILASVRKTGRMVIAHEAWTSGGFGAEVAALVADQALMELDAPIRRIGALDVPMPYNDVLERAVIPSQERLVEEIRAIAKF